MFWNALYMHEDDFKRYIQDFYDNFDIDIMDFEYSDTSNEFLIIDINHFKEDIYNEINITKKIIGENLLSKVLIATKRTADLVAYFIYDYFEDLNLKFNIEKIIIRR